MARKHDQDDVFKQLNDSPDTETEESQGSGRGLEIKLVLLGLVLVIGAISYVGYLKLKPGDDPDQMAADSSRLQLDAEQTVPGQVVPAHVASAIEPGADTAGQPLVMTQWNDVAQPENQTESAWTSSKDVADPIPQPIEADANQSYAANCGNDTLSAPAGSTETTFAPMPNPGNFAAGTAAPLPSESTTPSPAKSPQGLYGDQVAAAALEPPLPDTLPGQTATMDPSASNPVATSPANLQASPPASDFRASSRSDYSPIDSAPVAELSNAPAYQAPTESYAQAAPPYASNQSPASSYTLSEQGTTAAPATGPTPYDSPSTDTLPAQDNYQAYSHPSTMRTHADYAGLSAGNASAEQPSPEAWQEPTVVPVDGKYTARPNDNFYTISKKVYGTGAYFEALAKFNAAKYPTANQIRIGDIVETPPVGTLEGRYPELCPKPEHRDAARRRSQAVSGRSLAGRRVYVVQEGDNLFDIARFELGARAKVADLIELNRDVLGDHINYLTPGMRLVLPETEDRGPTVTQRPTNTLR